MESTPKVKMVGFRRLQVVLGQDKPKILSFQQPKLNIVIIDIAATPSEKHKLHECQTWIKHNPKLQLWKITKKQAFYPLYLDMMKQVLPVYIISTVGIQQLEDQPITKAYKILLEKGQSTLERVMETSSANIQKIRIILLKEDIQKLHKFNYFHGGVALITAEPTYVTKLLGQQADRLVLDGVDQSSSVNTEQVEQFAMNVENKVEEGIKVPSPSKVDKYDSQRQAWQAMHSTPGVGSYNLSK